MDNLDELADALPETESKLMDLPHELREKINKAIIVMGIEEIKPYNERKGIAEAERIRRRGIYQNSQHMHNMYPTTTTVDIMHESEQDLLEAQRESIRANREYSRMMRVISFKISVYGRLLRTINERAF